MAETNDFRAAVELDTVRERPIIVTGAAGFIGYHVARRLLTAGYQVVGVDNLNNRKYFLFHPFPQRTVSAELRHSF